MTKSKTSKIFISKLYLKSFTWLVFYTSNGVDLLSSKDRSQENGSKEDLECFKNYLNGAKWSDGFCPVIRLRIRDKVRIVFQRKNFPLK